MARRASLLVALALTASCDDKSPAPPEAPPDESPVLPERQALVAGARASAASRLAKRVAALRREVLFLGKVRARDNAGSLGSRYEDGAIDGTALATLVPVGAGKGCQRLTVHVEDRRVELEQCGPRTKAGAVLKASSTAGRPFACDGCVSSLDGDAAVVQFGGSRLSGAWGTGAPAWVELFGTMKRVPLSEVPAEVLGKTAPHAFGTLLTGGAFDAAVWTRTHEAQFAMNETQDGEYRCVDVLRFEASVRIDLHALDGAALTGFRPLRATHECCTQRPDDFVGDGWFSTCKPVVELPLHAAR